MENPTKQNKLSATNLKNILWDTLLKVKGNEMEAGQADAIASQAREIIRTTTLQLKIASQSARNIPSDVIHFSENTK